MIVPSLITRLYTESLPYVQRVRERVASILTAHCRENKFLYEDRIKALDSVAEKLETGRFKNWEQLDDLFAATVVIPLVTDEEGVLHFLEERFETLDLKKRGLAKKPPDTFRFDSTRFIGRLRREADAGEGVEPPIYSIAFEVQVKTVFEYAWTKTTHALAYKGPNVSWARQRLAAQLKAAAEQMDMLVLGFDSLTGFIGAGAWPGVQDRCRIEEFFRKRVESGGIPSEMAPKDWTRFADNAYRVFQLFSGEHPYGQGQRGIGKLDELLKVLDSELSTLGSQRILRSLSLLQLVVGVLSSAGVVCEKQSGFYFLRTQEMDSLYPKAKIPCDTFGEGTNA